VQQQGQTVGYARVSSSDQNLARQVEAIGPVDRLFEEKVSGGSRADRIALADCVRYVRDGDTVRVASMDRLARSVIDLQQIVDEILAKGAAVHFIKENQTYSTTSDDAMGRLLLHILGAFAEFERRLIRDRQAEGIKLAKAAGKYKGRAKRVGPTELARANEEIRSGVPKTQVAKALGVNRATLYRALADQSSDQADASSLQPS
jgi:DNA invertase Pin-like site-specific DNA recombinase